MKDPMKVQWWRRWSYTLHHWTWCELHFGSHWARRLSRRAQYNAAGGILIVLALMFFTSWGIAIILAAFRWLMKVGT